jgi:ribosomal protein S27AE
MKLWFRVDVDYVLGAKFLELAPDLRAAWLSLHALAARHGGPIPGLRNYTPRMLDREVGMKFSALKRLTDVRLISWVGDGDRDCAVTGFDADAAAHRILKAEKARNSARARWSVNANSSTSHMRTQSDRNANAERPQCEPDAVAYARQIRDRDRVRDPSLHGAGASGASALATTGSGPGSSTPDAPPEHPVWQDAPPGEPPPEQRPPARREPPRQEQRTGYAVSGSVTPPARACVRCGKASHVGVHSDGWVCLPCWRLPRSVE